MTMESRFPYTTELDDLSIIICLRKSEDSVHRISIFNTNEILATHSKLFAMLQYE